MNKILCYLLPLLFLLLVMKNKPQSEVKESGVAIVIHGGAGTILKKTCLMKKKDYIKKN